MEVFVSILNGLALFFLFKGFMGYISKSRSNAVVKEKDAEAEIEDKQEETVEMVHDFICNTTIRKDQAYILLRNGKQHYFCSWGCRNKFINESS